MFRVRVQPHPQDPQRLRLETPDRAVVDGRFAEAKELIAGSWMIQVKDMDFEEFAKP